MANFFRKGFSVLLALLLFLPCMSAIAKEEFPEIVVDETHYLILDADHLSPNEFLRQENGVFAEDEIVLPDELMRVMMRLSNTALTYNSFYLYDPNVKSALDVYGFIGTDLQDLFDWTAKTILYNEDEEAKEFYEYAAQGFSAAQGNCYTFASVFYYLAKGLGYPVRIVDGTVRYRDGTQGEHSWCLINVDGKEYIYDPQAQQQLGNSTRSFFLVDPLNPPIRYQYPEGQTPLGGYQEFE